ncbi:MAG: amidohydrolase family protein [Rhodoplanes sp.]|uniref:amidohydrolase family protein n=1 Tax=Rhodoplanes sp. TaxID=1968906 RepID=UPI00181AB176|nr:amidohydrolase family protein [Rhodoplanes sp.]NVO16765.1 amidohydrolase family protein [Rhodoplanes sp.]
MTNPAILPTDTPIIDTHVHVFTRALPLAAGRRHSPSGDFPPADLFAVAGRHGIDRIVLVQPSFLGTDNAYLVETLALAPEKLRGIVVVDPSVADAQLDAFARAGVVGIRLNLLGKDVRDVLAPDWTAMLKRIAARGWQIEIQAQGRDLPVLIDGLAPLGAPLVIDHFGRPDPALGIDDPGFRRLLAAGPDGPLHVKISGSYRCGGADAAPYAGALLDALGPGRLLWGSDWPFTEFEATRRYEDGITELRTWLTPAEQAAVAETSRKLFGFAG